MFPFRCRSTCLLLFFLATTWAGFFVRADDFYPPLPAAKSSIDFDNRGFLVNGKRTFIASAGMEYARVPRALWRDRLLRIKRSGFNCVEIYAFWNYHEVQEGKFDFTGDKDVGAFLDLVHEMGLYATVRVGPYVCAEWENGGYPLYTRFMPGLRTRQNEPLYLSRVDEWYNHILPIVASHQIDRGGSVIMVQLENEDDEGWGTAVEGNPDPYFKHLMDSARAHGIEVLTFFSGMNHGGDPAPKEPISSKGRPDPWYSTEYWSGWYSMYGAFQPTGDNSLIHFDRAAWRFLENGGNGFNVYMFHGGSNFATWNNNETSASYDYAGAVGQAGDLRPIYYKYKRVALFGRSFEEILENCDNATDTYKNEVSGVTVVARSGPAGTLVFLDNPSDASVDAKLKDGSDLTLAAGEVVGLVRDFALDPTFKIASSEARILGFARQGDTTTLVVYGAAGESGRLDVGLTLASGVQPVLGDWTMDAGNASGASLKVIFPAKGPEVHLLKAGAKTLRVVAMSSELADDTYFIDSGKSTYVVAGAPYVDDFTPTSSAARLTAETPLEATTVPAISIYGPDGATGELPAVELPKIDTTDPALGSWESATTDAEAAPDFDDSQWKTSDDPAQMGADGDTSAYAWYRTTINADAVGTKYLQVPRVGDHAILFVNGQRQPGTFGPGGVTIPITLQAGANTLAFLTSHTGRNKLGAYGAIEKLDMKGLVGPITLSSTQTPQVFPDQAVAQDYWLQHPTAEALADPNLDTSDPKWSTVSFQGNYGGEVPAAWRDPFVCIRAKLPAIAGPHRVLHFGFEYEKLTAFLNGQKIGEQAVAGVPFDLSLDAAWKEGGPNVLVLILENSHAEATAGMLSLTSGAPGTVVKGWKMRGGVTDYRSPALKWAEASDAASGVPTYYRTKFPLAENYYRNATPVLRFSAKEMSRGFAWLNGHNVGRYPEKIQVDGLYLPECWMRGSTNHLVVFDEEGAAVKTAHLEVETVASRRVVREGN